jgi:hypothetical protein
MVELGIVACVILAAGAARFNWKKWWYRKDINVLAPDKKRKDLYFGFYGCQNEQVAETRGAVNLLMESQWEGTAQTIANIKAADVDVMLDVSPQLFVREATGFVLRSDGFTALQELFSALKLAGVLHKVVAVYPIDEPNNTVGVESTLVLAVATIKAVLQLHDLRNVKLATTYAADKPFIAQERFDWIGYDDYDMKSSILVSRKFRAFADSLKPEQKIMLIPGAAYGQNPAPFVNYAQSHPEVAVVLPFLWCDGREADVGAKGARSNGMAKTYLEAGAAIVAG